MDLVSFDSRRLCALRQRSQGRCIVFNDQAMPPGTIPDRARVGVEQDNGGVSLLVDRCTPPAGTPADVGRWLRTGSLRFGDFDALARWLRETLAPVYQQPDSSSSAPADLRNRRRFLDAATITGELERQVIGQRPALTTICEAGVRHVARVSPRRPLTILCIGPTGVGKTSAAASLAETLAAHTGHDWGFVRLDGPELQESHTVARLFGAPPGYVGYGDATPLADTLRSNPFSVVLVDEIDKAADSVFRAFIGLLDTGRMTSTAGEIDARRAIFMFTSNLAADGTLSDIDASGSLDDAGLVDRIARRHLRRHGVLPELVSRITHIAVFSRLDAATRAAIAELAVRRVAATYGVEVTSIDPQALTGLASDSTDLASGVRSIEYRADTVLGTTLMQAAQAGTREPIRLVTNSDGEWQWEPADASDSTDGAETSAR